MLYLIAWLLIILTSSSDILAQSPGWKKVDIVPKSPYSNSYRDIKCYDSSNCIIWAETGSNDDYYFRRTTDGGKTWDNIFFSDKFAPQICAIAYPSANLFIATTCNGSIIRTTDKGMNWEKAKMDSMQRIGRLNMYNDKIGLGIGGGIEPFKYLYFRTIDGGVTWKVMNTPQRFFKETIESPQLIDSNLFVGYCYRRDSLFFETIWVEGDWENWHSDKVTKDIPQNPLASYFIDRKKGWIAGGRTINAGSDAQLILYTEDSGKSWIKQRDTNYYAYPLVDIKFYDENYGMATGGKFAVLKTDNGGSNWEIMRIANDDILGGIHSIQITSPTSAYVIRDGDGVYKYFESLGVEELTIENGELRISPNPVSDILRIRGVPSTFLVRIFTPEGIKVIECEFKSEIDVRSLAAGLYFVQVGNKVEKFVVIR